MQGINKFNELLQTQKYGMSKAAMCKFIVRYGIKDK
jgi:uncharacterized protein YlaN (UPF0358 family)